MGQIIEIEEENYTLSQTSQCLSSQLNVRGKFNKYIILFLQHPVEVTHLFSL